MNEAEYALARKVFATFGCQTLGNYHNLYLKTDTLLLACVAENFKKLCYDTYDLNGTQYFISSHLSRDAFNKICRADVHFLTDREHLELSEHIIQGGFASVFWKRFFQPNKKYMKTFNTDEETSFGLLLDANNYFVAVMEKLLFLSNASKKLRSRSEILSLRISIQLLDIFWKLIWSTSDYLHDLHEVFPLAPTKENIEEKFLSDFQLNLLEKMGVKN